MTEKARVGAIDVFADLWTLGALIPVSFFFFFFFFKSNNPACGLDHGRDSGASRREAPYGPESRRKE